MYRVVIFTNKISFVPSILIRGTLAALKSRDDVQLVAVCLPRPPKFWRMLLRYLRKRVSRDIPAILRRDLRDRPALPFPVHLKRWSSRFDFQVLTPPKGDFNHQAFIELLRGEYKPTVALSYYCNQKLSQQLLAVFSHTVNYHNAFLPKYGGLDATRWSVYYGEKETGFTFHRMTADFDKGPILHQDAVPVRRGHSIEDLEWEKAYRAAECIPHVLSRVIEGDLGRPQSGEGTYFSRSDSLSVRRIPDPASLSSGELTRRLMAFECLEMLIADTWYKVKGMRQLPSQSRGYSAPCFQASDGIMIQPTRYRRLRRI